MPAPAPRLSGAAPPGRVAAPCGSPPPAPCQVRSAQHSVHARVHCEACRAVCPDGTILVMLKPVRVASRKAVAEDVHLIDANSCAAAHIIGLAEHSQKLMRRQRTAALEANTLCARPWGLGATLRNMFRVTLPHLALPRRRRSASARTQPALCPTLSLTLNPGHDPTRNPSVYPTRTRRSRPSARRSSFHSFITITLNPDPDPTPNPDRTWRSRPSTRRSSSRSTSCNPEP